MTAFLVANLAPIMFGSLIVFLLFGYPVAFSLAACGLSSVSSALSWAPSIPRSCKACRCA
jgi:TRAP-type mannitol/chloroaromatic compound transport system permease large subunit